MLVSPNKNFDFTNKNGGNLRNSEAPRLKKGSGASLDEVGNFLAQQKFNKLTDENEDKIFNGRMTAPQKNYTGKNGNNGSRGHSQDS